MRLRALVLALAGCGIPLALLVLALPITWGYGGYIENTQGVLKYVDPQGPAGRAGLREGDVVVRSGGWDQLKEDAGNVGTTVGVRVREHGRIRTVKVQFEAFTGQLAVQQEISKVVGALTALVAFIVAMLVVLRARDERVGARAAIVLLLAGLGAFTQGAALVCGNEVLGTYLYWLLPRFFSIATISAALYLLATFPPNVGVVRSVLGRLAFVPVAWVALESIAWAYDTWFATHISVLDSNGVDQVTQVVFMGMLAAAIVDGMITVPKQYATAMRWLGSLWLLGVMLMAAPHVAILSDRSTLGYSHYKDVFVSGAICCLALGVAYPVLRHRLVDLNILVSRATVFTIVSAIIVGIFVAAEWSIGKIFEESFGLAARHGWISQLLSLCVVLLLGISARSIHAFVERRLSKTFFRRRMQGLEAIQRVAHEADSARDVRAFLQLAVTTVIRALEPLDAAFYLRSGDGYERAGNATSTLPPSFAYDDAAPLRLRRWQQPFESDDDLEERHLLFVPMIVRGELLGFLCCGPKPDRTKYLSDEISALSLLTDRAGIASALLAHAPLTALPSLA